MKKLLVILILLFLPLIVEGAVSTSAVWEVRTGGSLQNGGLYVSGGGGTDYSQQNASEDSNSDLEVKGGDFDRVYSAATDFDQAKWVGNGLYIIDTGNGGNFTPGWYEITGRGNDGDDYLDLDRDCSIGNDTGASWELGGAVTMAGSPDTWLEQVSGGQVVHIETGTYNLIANVNVILNGSIHNPVRFFGYNTARNDAPTIASGNQPVIAAGANEFKFNDYYQFFYIKATTTEASGWRSDVGALWVECEVNQSSGTAFRDGFNNGAGSGRVIRSEVDGTGGNNVDGVAFGGGTGMVINSYIHDCGSRGISLSSLDRFKILNNIIDTCGDGIELGSTNTDTMIAGNTIYNNTIGLQFNSTSGSNNIAIFNNIFDANTTAFLTNDGGTVNFGFYIDYNVWDNTTDMTWDNGGSEDNSYKGANAVNGDPSLNDPANGDFTLQSGSNAIGAGLSSNNIGATGDYSDVNIGVDQDDNTAAGAGGGGAGFFIVY